MPASIYPPKQVPTEPAPGQIPNSPVGGGGAPPMPAGGEPPMPQMPGAGGGPQAMTGAVPPQIGQQPMPSTPEELRMRFNALSPAEKDIIAAQMTPELGTVLCKMLGGSCDDMINNMVLRVPGERDHMGGMGGGAAAPSQPAAAMPPGGPPTDQLQTLPAGNGGNPLAQVVAR
jgi:hypothetical protein